MAQLKQAGRQSIVFLLLPLYSGLHDQEEVYLHQEDHPLFTVCAYSSSAHARHTRTLRRQCLHPRYPNVCGRQAVDVVGWAHKCDHRKEQAFPLLPYSLGSVLRLRASELRKGEALWSSGLSSCTGIEPHFRFPFSLMQMHL